MICQISSAIIVTITEQGRGPLASDRPVGSRNAQIAERHGTGGLFLHDQGCSLLSARELWSSNAKHHDRPLAIWTKPAIIDSRTLACEQSLLRVGQN